MAVGDFWDVSTTSSNGSAAIPDQPPTGERSTLETDIFTPAVGFGVIAAVNGGPHADPFVASGDDDVGAESGADAGSNTGKVRLALAKVLPPAEAKHRGGGRRSGAAKHAGIALAELEDVDEAMRRRNDILVAAIKRTQDLYIVTDQRQVFRLAATDLFVERAQFVLAQRARSMWRSGVVSTASAVALLIALAAFLVWRSEAISSRFLSGNDLALGLVEMIATAAIVFFAVVYLVRLSRSFFNENVSIVAKQHGLGFGRLYVYTNPDTVRLKDLQDAFGLDLESTPIFLDAKSKDTADTLYSRVTQDLDLSAGR